MGMSYITWRKNKFGAKRTEYQGYYYASKFEADVAQELDVRLKAGELTKVERQVRIPLEINGHHITNYYCDFRITHKDGSVELIEAKGIETQRFILIRKLMEAIYLEEHPEVTYTIVKNDRVWRPSDVKRRARRKSISR
jgi:hypothetical protein